MTTTPTLPDSTEGLLELVNDPQRFAALLQEMPLSDLLDKIAEGRSEAGDANGEISENLEQQRQIAAGELARKTGHDPAEVAALSGTASPVKKGKKFKFTARGARYNADGPAAELDNLFENTADFFATITPPEFQDRGQRRRLAEQLSAMNDVIENYSEQVPSGGGFLLPETLRNQLEMIALEQSIVAPRAQVLPMSSLTMSVPIVDDTDHTSNVFGGVVAQWTPEGGTLTPTSAKFGQTTLTAKKLTAFAVLPNELLMDSPMFSAFFDGMMPQAIAYFSDNAYLLGDGAKEPLGALRRGAGGNTATVDIARNGAGAVDWDDLLRMYAQLLPQSAGNAAWVISHDVFPELAQLQDAAGNAIWFSNAVGAPPVSIMGLPVLRSEKVPQLGTAGDVSLVDFSQYLIGDRQEITAAYSTERYFETDETAYRIILRADGRPWMQSPLTPANGGPALSSFVQLV